MNIIFVGLAHPLPNHLPTKHPMLAKADYSARTLFYLIQLSSAAVHVDVQIEEGKNEMLRVLIFHF